MTGWTVWSRTWGSPTWLVLHIIILSSIEPNQGQNTSPWAWRQSSYNYKSESCLRVKTAIWLVLALADIPQNEQKSYSAQDSFRPPQVSLRSSQVSHRSLSGLPQVSLKSLSGLSLVYLSGLSFSQVSLRPPLALLPRLVGQTEPKILCLVQYCPTLR